MATTTFQGYVHASVRLVGAIGGEALFGLAEVSTKARGDIEETASSPISHSLALS
jgi:hypothetical protein